MKTTAIILLSILLVSSLYNAGNAQQHYQEEAQQNQQLSEALEKKTRELEQAVAWCRRGRQ